MSNSKRSAHPNRDLEARRLSVPGTQVHLEPVPTLGRQARPLREPRPDLKAGEEQGSEQRGSAEGGPEDIRPRSEVHLQDDRLLSGEVQGSTGLSHTWLRQKNLFAETRALRGTGEGAIGRKAQLKVRLSGVEAALLGEAKASIPYRSPSAYVRAAATGRDRLAPAAARAGALFVWVRACLGQQVAAEEWEGLRRLMQVLFGTGQIRGGLRLARRHLQAAHLQAEDKLDGPEGLPPAPEATREKATEFPQPAVSIRLSKARKQLIREIADYSKLNSMSSFARHMALGGERNPQVLAQGAVIARWIEGHLGEEIAPEQWEGLEDVFRQRFGIFLLGAGSSGEIDVEGALQRGAEHLLGTPYEAAMGELPISL